jgi:hypothetical protein
MWAPNNKRKEQRVDSDDFKPFNPRKLLTYKRTTLDQGFAILRCLRPIPTKNVSLDLSRLALGLMGLTTWKLSLNNFTSWL